MAHGAAMYGKSGVPLTHDTETMVQSEKRKEKRFLSSTRFPPEIRLPKSMLRLCFLGSTYILCIPIPSSQFPIPTIISWVFLIRPGPPWGTLTRAR